MMQLPILPPVQYSKPMPLCVRMRPSSTVSPPGPTCFQPVKSLPLNSCCHLSGSPLQAFSSEANKRVGIAANKKIQIVKRFNMGKSPEFSTVLLGQINLLRLGDGNQFSAENRHVRRKDRNSPFMAGLN